MVNTGGNMPIYEYACQYCGHQMEKLQKMSDPALVDCPACQRPELQKQVSAAAFRLSGKGWYETDFKTGNQRHLKEDNSAKAEKTEAACGPCACPNKEAAATAQTTSASAS